MKQVLGNHNRVNGLEQVGSVRVALGRVDEEQVIVIRRLDKTAHRNPLLLQLNHVTTSLKVTNGNLNNINIHNLCHDILSLNVKAAVPLCYNYSLRHVSN
jgi:hypothetical protein